VKQETKTPFSNYPDLNREILRRDKKYINFLRAWYIFRAYDKKECNGQGCIPKSKAIEVLSYITGFKSSYIYQILNGGEGLFWTISEHNDNNTFLHYYGIKKIAIIFDIPRYSEENIMLIEECLVGDTALVRANLYVTAIGKNSSYTPIARETITKYYNVSINTQRKYEKISTVPMQKTPSYILHTQVDSLQKATEVKNKIIEHENSNPNCVKIKRDSHNNFLVLYQRGNLYSTIGAQNNYPSTLRKCNNELKERRRRMIYDCQIASDHNDERLAGAPEDRDYQIYYFQSKSSRGRYYNHVLKKDRYVYDKIIEASTEHPYYGGNCKKHDICLYKPEFCHKDSPFKKY
jgi:hypothetical protein